jgi:hypothetical protein
MTNEERIAKLESAVSDLQAELWVSQMPLDEVDFAIHKDPPKATATYAGCKISEVDDMDYLQDLAKFYSWCAYKDRQAEGDSEEATKKRKYAVYRAKDAAKVRRMIAHKKQAQKDPF